jgi:hypothetical protein
MLTELTWGARRRPAFAPAAARTCTLGQDAPLEVRVLPAGALSPVLASRVWQVTDTWVDTTTRPWSYRTGSAILVFTSQGPGSFSELIDLRGYFVGLGPPELAGSTNFHGRLNMSDGILTLWGDGPAGADFMASMSQDGNSFGSGNCDYHPDNSPYEHGRVWWSAEAAPATGSVALTPLIDGANVVPRQATDLHLRQVYGTEQVLLPVSLTNTGQLPAQGAVSLEVSLANDQGQVIASVSDQPYLSIDLAPGKSLALPLAATVPSLSRLPAGSPCYFVVEVTYTPFGGSPVKAVASTAMPFEYLGTPQHPTAFQRGDYFAFIRDTLTDDTKAARQQSAGINVADGPSFTAAFEERITYPYLNNQDAPTLGFGMNLNVVSGTVRQHLADDVRAYFQQHYPTDPLPGQSDDNIIASLKSLAHQHVVKQVISDADADALFAELYPTYSKEVVKAYPFLGTLAPRVQVAVVDAYYNTGTFFPAMMAALRTGDYALAGFQLVDALRTDQAYTNHWTGLLRRIEAEYANLLADQKVSLGYVG